MWITVLLIFTVLLSICRNRIRLAAFTQKNKPKQDIEIQKLYRKFEPRFTTTMYGSLPDTVDCVYCIYSDKRKEHVTNQFLQLGLNVTFFEAIFPQDITQENYETLSCINTNFCKISNKTTKLPVQLSFTMCLLNALKNKYKTIMIFEDDIITNVDLDTLNESLKEFNSSPFDMFYMGYCNMSCNQKFDKNKHKYLVEVPNKKLKCHHAVVLKMNHVSSLIKYLFPMVKNKDVGFDQFIRDYKRRVCVPRFSYFDQDRINLGTDNANYGLFLRTCDLS